MPVAYLMMRVDLSAAQPVCETVILATTDQLAVIGDKVWVQLCRSERPTQAEADRAVVAWAREQPALSRLLERLYVPRALPLAASEQLLAMAEQGKRR